MSEYGPTYNEIDSYIEDLTEAERDELAKADTAIELAFLFHDAREARGLTQAEAAQQASLRQQAVSRFEQPDMKLANTKINTLRKYMAALDYVVQIAVKDAKSGALVKQISLPPWQDVKAPATSPVARFFDDQAVYGTAVGQKSDAVGPSTRAALAAFQHCKESTSGNVAPPTLLDEVRITPSRSALAAFYALAGWASVTADVSESALQEQTSCDRFETTAEPKPEKGSVTGQQNPRESALAA